MEVAERGRRVENIFVLVDRWAGKFLDFLMNLYSIGRSGLNNCLFVCFTRGLFLLNKIKK